MTFDSLNTKEIRKGKINPVNPYLWLATYVDYSWSLFSLHYQIFIKHCMWLLYTVICFTSILENVLSSHCFIAGCFLLLNHTHPPNMEYLILHIFKGRKPYTICQDHIFSISYFILLLTSWYPFYHHWFHRA